MPRNPEKRSEFQRYRQVLAALYLGTVASGIVLLAASVVKSLYFRPVVALSGPILDADHPAPEDLLKCTDDVAALYRELATTSTGLLARASAVEASAGAAADGDLLRVDRDGRLLPAWEQFSQRWLGRWDEVNAWCRFSELSGGQLGDAYDGMAQVHADLRAMRLKYQDLLVRFDAEQAEELADMRGALERARRALTARVQPEEPAP